MAKSKKDSTEIKRNIPDVTLFTAQTTENMSDKQAISDEGEIEKTSKEIKQSDTKSNTRKNKAISKYLNQDPKDIPFEILRESVSKTSSSSMAEESNLSIREEQSTDEKYNKETDSQEASQIEVGTGDELDENSDTSILSSNLLNKTTEGITSKTEDEEFRNQADQSKVILKEKFNKSVTFDPDKPIYFEIHKGNIYHYFSKAILAPSKYLSNRAFSDLQSAHGGQLILSNTASNSDPEMVLLKLRLSKVQLRNLTIHENIALMANPLPITCVESIIVKNKELKDTILNDAALFDGGFIPESFFSIETIKSIKPEASNLIPDEDDLNLSFKIDKFDRILGLLAFLRNYNLLTSKGTGVYKSISDHFFLAMQAVDHEFGSAILSNSHLSEFYGYLFNENCPDDKPLLKWIFSRLIIPENFNDIDLKDFMHLFAKVKDEAIPIERMREINTNLKDAIKRKSTLRLVDGISAKSTSLLPLYIFTYLRNYAQENNILIARRDVISQTSNAFGEYAFGLLGYFYGYAALANSEERINEMSEAASYAVSVKEKPVIKFKIEKAFDSTVIDIIFNHIFGGVELERVSFKGILLEERQNTSADARKLVIVRRAEIIGETYEYIKVKTLVSELDTLISQINKADDWIGYHSELGFLCQKLSMVPEVSAITAKKIFTHGLAETLREMRFSKTELVERLRHPSMKIKTEELYMRISLAKESKEL
ncbi:hypothetical protein [Pedobacter sp.]